jgi:hypothetical protein
MTKWKIRFEMREGTRWLNALIQIIAAASPKRTDLCDAVRIKLERCFGPVW